jgi:hypothetical protein
MYTRCIAIRFVLVFAALFASSAHAFFDPPWITPENPIAGETISINIHGGVCDAIFGEEGYPQITRDGNAIHMRWFGQHYPEGSGDLLCSYPVGTLVEPIGAYAAGDYTITVELAYDDFLEGPSVLTIGVVLFTVAGTPNPAAIPAPTLDAVGAFVLLALLAGLGLWKRPTSRASWFVLALICVPLGACGGQDDTRVGVGISQRTTPLPLSAKYVLLASSATNGRTRQLLRYGQIDQAGLLATRFRAASARFERTS